jgi:hypothetical protein|tara:strand:- start:123 stop:446 length:324 start_codon:yes stop_codon:yes gene_type:complete
VGFLILSTYLLKVNQKGENMAYLIVKRKEDNVVEWIGESEYCTWKDVAGADPVTHFTIDEADNTWGLPSDGFDLAGREKITYDGNLPEGFSAGTSTLTGTEGSYTWG